MEKANSVKKITESIRNSNDEFIENELRPFLRISSNTLNHEGIIEAKNYLVSYISKFSEEINEYRGEINPLIIARVEGKLKKPLLIYMMYDTQPVSQENEWISKPFGAEIKLLQPPLEKLGNCIIARGAYNSKTPLLCFLNIIKILKEYKSLPISLVLLFDGDEEKGSPSLLKFLENEKYKLIFKNCIDAYYPATKQDLRQKSVLKLGYKGILSFTIKISSKNEEPHSAFSGMIPNPAADLVSLLNIIYSNKEFQIHSLKFPYMLTSDDIRFAHDISVNALFQEIKEKIDTFSKGTQSEIELIRNVGYESSRVNKESILVKSLIKSAEVLGVSTELWPLSAAAAPLTKIQRELGLDFITGGLGIGGFAHSANEFIQYDSIINTRMSNYYFLKFYSKRVEKNL